VNLELPPSDDSREPVQAAAHAALGQAVTAALDVLGTWRPDEMPSFLMRVTFQFASHLLQLMANSWKLLSPGEKTFTYASGASLCLRSVADLHAKLLAVWEAPDPGALLKEFLSDSLRQEILAIRAAAQAGADVHALETQLAILQRKLGTPGGVKVVETLTTFGEWETLTVFRWESAHVHVGTAALSAAGRTMEGEEAHVDIAMWPISLWRVAQLTWASYGLGVRSLSHACSRIGVDATELSDADNTFRQAARASALQLRPSDEPPSPQYGAFDFPLWPSGASTG
jgi:hypothetical protein